MTGTRRREHDVELESASQGPDLRLLPAAMGAWAGTGLTLSAGAGIRLVGAALLVVVAGALVLRARGGRRPADAASPALPVSLVLVSTALGLAAGALQAGVRDAGPVRTLADRGAVVQIEGTVASDPQQLEPMRAGQEPSVLLRLSVRSVDGRGERARVRSRVLVFADLRWLPLRWGERVAVSGRLAPAEPGDDVAATLDARGPPRVLAPAPAVARGAERLRAGLRTAVGGIAPDPAGLLPGLVVGDTSLQRADLVDDMKTTGLTHLSAVSGTNVTIVCVLALALAGWAGFGRRVRLVAAAAVLGCFVVLARPEPSVLRAAVMGAVGLLAVAGSRRRAGVPAISVAVVALLVVDPWLSRSYGFALSVLATLGLLLLARPWTTALARWLPTPLAAAVAIPLAAQAVCGPVIVLLSGQVSLVSLPANALVAPLVAPATVLGLASALASLVSPVLAHLLAVAASWPCALIALTARRFADVPHAQVAWPGGVAGAAGLAALTVLAVVAGPTLVRGARRRPARFAAAGVLVLAIATPLPGGSRPFPPAGWLLVACDVGQGDALVLRSASGHTVLVDAGPSPEDVDGCLRRLAVTRLDAVVLTHFHADHVDGLPAVLAGRQVAQLLVTPVDDPVESAAQVRARAAAAAVPVRAVRAGERLVIGDPADGLTLDVVWPARVLDDGSIPNNASIVLDAHVDGVRLLLTGDIEPAAARAVALSLRGTTGGGAVDVLKVSHHGSAKQDPGLLAQLHPRLALVSVGQDNGYGHPAPQTLQLLAAAGARVARTDLSGDLAVVHDGSGLSLMTSGPRDHAPVLTTGHGE